MSVFIVNKHKNMRTRNHRPGPQEKRNEEGGLNQDQKTPQSPIEFPVEKPRGRRSKKEAQYKVLSMRPDAKTQEILHQIARKLDTTPPKVLQKIVEIYLSERGYYRERLDL